MHKWGVCWCEIAEGRGEGGGEEEENASGGFMMMLLLLSKLKFDFASICGAWLISERSAN